MPLYIFKCSRCGLVFDHIECTEHRNDAQVCPGCNGPASRNIEEECAGRKQIPEHTRLSKAMGVNPEQIPEAMKAYPGSEYTPNGDLIIHSRQHKLKEMKRRGMEEL
jgi:putative FmdB family regulatory protein